MAFESSTTRTSTTNFNIHTFLAQHSHLLREASKHNSVSTHPRVGLAVPTSATHTLAGEQQKQQQPRNISREVCCWPGRPCVLPCSAPASVAGGKAPPVCQPSTQVGSAAACNTHPHTYTHVHACKNRNQTLPSVPVRLCVHKHSAKCWKGGGCWVCVQHTVLGTVLLYLSNPVAADAKALTTPPPQAHTFHVAAQVCQAPCQQ